jgi:hypothetical protein
METATKTRGSADQISTVQPESGISRTWRDRVGHVWHQLRAEVQDINYVARRSVELQMRLPK